MGRDDVFPMQLCLTDFLILLFAIDMLRFDGPGTLKRFLERTNELNHINLCFRPLLYLFYVFRSIIIRRLRQKLHLVVADS